MDKKQAQALIKRTFESPFDKDSFVAFAKNLLNDVEDAPFIYRGNFIPDAYEQYITTLERIGKYNDGEHEIDVLIAKLKKESSIERARTMQRNFVAWYLNGSRGGKMKDAALVAFVSPNERDWRFSLVKMDYRFEESKKGRMRVKEEFTPARRWSFLVGVNENSHTAQSQLVNLVADDERNPAIAQLEEAFNIEKVTKEFFEKYRELFLWTKETLEGVVKKDKKIREDFESKGVNTVDFSKKLLGQIVFLYFLQKKGWFGVKRDDDWGTGPKNFLRELFEKKHGSYSNFFNDILEPLFYEALARERDDDFYSRFDCKIPFLNGGLFDPINDYDWVHTDILLPNDLFSNSYKTKQGDKGNGILDIFDRYNFTVKEDEPLEKEVAVDPEMLGKVFENLLDVKDRKSKGTYYTPREIVHYMCVQSLVNYLASELEGKVTKEDCEKLIRYGETVGENEARVMAMGKETQTYYYKLADTIRANAKLIDEKLADIKICDPAIGSGAFPVGMMAEIVRTRNMLSSYIKDSNRTLYNFKRDCIHNSLYGVDIDPGAVEIAKLRLWLSLVVDEEDIKQIKPLPNLEYKIMQGNSLLEEFEGVRLFDDRIITAVDFDKGKQISDLKERQSNLSAEYIKLHQANKLSQIKRMQLNDDLKKINSQIRRISQSGKKVEETGSLFDTFSTAKKKSDALKQLHKEFFETTQKTKKDDLKRRIEKLEWDLIEVTLKEQSKQSELKKLEEFRRSNIKPFFLWKLNFSEVFQNGGFDVVIANPPYGANIDDVVEVYKKRYYESIKHYADIFKIFFHLGLDICKKEGIETFITPNTYLTQPRYNDLRRYLLKYGLVAILNLGQDVFEGVEVPVAVTIIMKTEKKSKFDFCDLSVNSTFSGDLTNITYKTVEQEKILQSPDASLLSIYEFKENEVPLDEVLWIKDAGIQYHRSGIGLKNKGGSDLYSRIFYSDRKHFKNYKPTWYGKLINSYYAKKDTNEFFNLEYKKVLKSNETVSFSQDAFDQKEKILWRQTAPHIKATLDTKKRWFRNTIQCAWVKEKYSKTLDIRYVLALVNSRYLRWVYNKIVNESGRVFPQVKVTHVKKLPLHVIPSKEQTVFVSIVDKILNITKDEDYLENSIKQAKIKEYERQINQMVYKLYGLTKEEIKIVEGFGRED